MTKIPETLPLDELLAGITKENLHSEIGTGSPVGAEYPLLVAKPRPGPVDYADICRRIIARFPKVLAYLAK